MQQKSTYMHKNGTLNKKDKNKYSDSKETAI
jgi:hypothetical protein